MTTFREQLAQAIRTNAIAEPTKTPWDDVLDEFVTWLGETYGSFLNAWIERDAHPGLRRIRLSPQWRRNQRSTLMTIHVTNEIARVSSKKTIEFKAVEDLQKHLINFVRLPMFHESLDELRSHVDTSVTGVLRVGAERKARNLLADITVEVPAVEQRRLGEASEATPPQHVDNLYVIPAGPTVLGRGTYSEHTQPIWLVAGGYALQIESNAKEPDDRIRLSGTPVPPSSLD